MYLTEERIERLTSIISEIFREDNIIDFENTRKIDSENKKSVA